jgi:hypothetical protein
MKKFAVWETEYQDEGSTLHEAHTDKGAMRAYRKETGERCSRDDLTPLSTSEMTPELLAARMDNE